MLPIPGGTVSHCEFLASLSWCLDPTIGLLNFRNSRGLNDDLRLTSFLKMRKFRPQISNQQIVSHGKASVSVVHLHFVVHLQKTENMNNPQLPDD